jgi:hypothetical protein
LKIELVLLAEYGVTPKDEMQHNKLYPKSTDKILLTDPLVQEKIKKSNIVTNQSMVIHL